MIARVSTLLGSEIYLTMESMIPKLGPKVLESVFSFPGPQSANLPLFHMASSGKLSGGLEMRLLNSSTVDMC